MSADEVHVPSWPAPKGYANGRIGRGATLHIAGQVGWTSPGVFEAKDLVGQFGQALANMRVVLDAAGGKVTDIASMTVFVTDIAAYRATTRALGPVWKQHMGAHFPAMALVGVTSLVEVEALVEIQAVAYVE